MKIEIGKQMTSKKNVQTFHDQKRDEIQSPRNQRIVD